MSAARTDVSSTSPDRISIKLISALLQPSECQMIGDEAGDPGDRYA